MIKAIKYSKGNVKKTEFKSLNFLRELSWIDCYNPTEEELKLLYDKTGITVTDLKDALDFRELPRIQNKLKYSKIIFRIPSSNYTIPLGIFVTKKFIVTIHKENIEFLEKLMKNLISDTGQLIFKNGTSFLVYRIMLDSIREFTRSLDKIGEALEDIEEDIFKNASEHNSQKIFSSKRRLLYFKRSLNGNKNVIENITKTKFIAPNSYDSFSNLHIELSQVISVEETYRERLTESMEMHMTSVSNKLNEVMRSFTVIASLLLLPVLIAGIWGMNFGNIPLFAHNNGFYVAILIMVVSMLIMFLFFKKKKWV